jgi:hypothetical protein
MCLFSRDGVFMFTSYPIAVLHFFLLFALLFLYIVRANHIIRECIVRIGVQIGHTELRAVVDDTCMSTTHAL